ncbi:ABC transporter substrate-binding protein [Kineosporia sp. NBRC 101731]|uniref:ABC transporter substrate-binding protein n=1 Tax=Kineosporia sp. NBRC 101731 TaxID=3032199 RepID=UPI0024A5A040|nr:ABC transporter substrate-binding protein [Kineosporia sp. NBRC 101731]GLY30408.1 ABC transporter substrate-binding protein [Kineosporia sp. NBRC 101731]
MNPFGSRRRILSGLAVPATCIALLAACGSGSDGGDTATAATSAPEVSSNADIFAKLPEDVQKSKSITVATEALYPPYEYLAEDGSTVIGLDIDLLDAVTARMGIDYELTNTAFDGLQPGLESKRYRVVMAAMSDTEERRAKFDFVDYYQAGQAIVVRKGNPENISGLADLCGQPVAVLVSSAQEALLKEVNGAECADDPIKVTSLQSDTDALTGVQSGRYVADVAQEPVARYNAEQVGGGNAFEVANAEPIRPNPLGVMLNKDDDELEAAFAEAFQSLVDDGTYAQILKKSDLASGAITEVTVNGGTE